MPSRPTAAGAGSQARRRKFECASGEPVEAASLFRVVHVFLPLGLLSQARAVASATASGLDKQQPTPEGLSLCGAFRLVLAIAAAARTTAPRRTPTSTRPATSPPS